MSLCRVTSKVLMTIMTLIFWGAAAGLIFVGAWVYHEYQHYEQIADAYYTLVPATIIIALGVFFFILGLVGCVGAFKDNRCLLGTFFALLLLILVGMVVAAGLGYVYRDDISASVTEGVNKGLNLYDNSTVIKSEIDFMQQKLKCCGGYNYTDWQSTPWFTKHHPKPTLPYPESCCVTTPCTPKTKHYTRGCYKYLRDEFLGHLGIIVGVGAGFAIIQILGMIAACALICRRRPENPYMGLASPEHMQA